MDSEQIECEEDDFTQALFYDYDNFNRGSGIS